jgi:hypothetical protein
MPVKAKIDSVSLGRDTTSKNRSRKLRAYEWQTSHNPIRKGCRPTAQGRADPAFVSAIAILQQLSEFLCKIDQFSSADFRIINNHEDQKDHSQAGTGCPLSDLRRGSRREVRTQHGTTPYGAASRPTLDRRRLIFRQPSDHGCGVSLHSDAGRYRA